mgnify:CR=1 FL=1
MFKRCYLYLVIIVSVIKLSACSQSAGQAQNNNSGERIFKLTTIVQPTHVWEKTAVKFNEELQTRSNGRMKVEIFPSSQLGQEKDMIQQIESGMVDFGFITNAYMSTRAPYFNAWFLPFLFDSVDEVIKMRDAKAAKKMLEKLGEQRLVGMDYLVTGNHHFLMAKGKIDSPNDLQGTKMRTTGAPIINESLEKLGATATPIPVNEVYTSIQTGIVDGIHASVDGIVTQRFYEVAKDYSMISAFAFPAVVVASEKTMDQLSPEDRKIVNEAMKAAVDWGIREAVKVDHEDLAKLKAQNLIIHEVQNKDEFRKAVKGIYKKYTEDDPLINEFIKEAQQE